MTTLGTGWRRDALLAVLLAAVLTAAWTLRDATALAAMRLPDTDDLMRLVQIRDWLGGQRFADLTQHRLGFDGVPMHWTRLADLGPAAIILLISPLAGVAAAERIAVVAWPALLFAGVLFVMARAARDVGGNRIVPVAMLLAALAHPATTYFAPGRIDHHGLQMLLWLIAVAGLLGPDRLLYGALIGGASAASLVVGMETAPLLALLAAILLAEAAWSGRRDRLVGYGGGLAFGLVAARCFAPNFWFYPACDGFTANAWVASVIGAAAVFAGAGATALRDRRHRLAAIGVVAALAAWAVWRLTPACLSPYGALDPLLVRVWLSQVAEARPLLATPAVAIGYGGLLVTGTLAAVHAVRAERTRGWIVILVLLVGALGLAMVQARAANGGALLACLPLARIVVLARARGGWRMAGAWLGSAGTVYALIAQMTVPATAASAPGGTADMGCTPPAMLATLARQPAGLVLAPVDAGAMLIAHTPHRVLAAPYHRAGEAILASYRFYRLPPPAARRMAERLGVRYVLACAAMPYRQVPGSMAAALQQGRAPLTGIARMGTTTLYRVTP
ncbi:hypothetical protein [Sphingomonas carotinifaciens]|uniref:hypothetical protein n=1 Tax=Sphingomonas carotinifaciens TaxID=1166323 RepID=UPI000DD6DB88|nr:hypothetical protein [Sphingomonas carotinifaciens]